MAAMSLDPPIAQSRSFAISTTAVAASPDAATVIDEDLEHGAALLPWVYSGSVRELSEFTARRGHLDRRFTPFAHSSILTTFCRTLVASNKLQPAVAGRCIQHEFRAWASH